MNTSPTTHRHLVRFGAVLAATASALIAWAFIAPFGGVELTVPGVYTVGAVEVAFASVVSGLAAVGLAALVDHRARRPRRTWTILATSVFGLSILGPLTSGAPLGITWSLVALHSVVAVIVIPQIRWTLREGQVRPRAEPSTA